MKRKINTIDLFAGCGGLLDGFMQEGSYYSLACVEWEKAPCETLVNRLKFKWGHKNAEEEVIRFDIQRTDELFAGFNDIEYGNHKGLDKLIGKKNVGWSSLQLDNAMLDFMSDWDRARRFLKREKNILGSGISYEYDEVSNTDTVITPTGQRLSLSSSSSGLQSLIPQFVHLDYLTNDQYLDNNKNISYEKKVEQENLSSLVKNEDTFSRFINTDHSEVFLEEPEDNLFPPTQCLLVNWLVENIGKHGDSLFIATHSPYVLNQLIKLDPKGLTVFFTHPSENDEHQYDVRQLTGDEVHEIYDNGVDMFFNFELYV